MTLDELTSQIMELAKSKGFGTKREEIDVFEKMVLIHSEVSEALAAYRENDEEHLKGNLADVLIRTIHLAGVFGFNVEETVKEKLTVDQTREWDWNKLITNTKVKE